jgi:hypothetical protein
VRITEKIKELDKCMETEAVPNSRTFKKQQGHPIAYTKTLQCATSMQLVKHRMFRRLDFIIRKSFFVLMVFDQDHKILENTIARDTISKFS